MGYRSKVYAIVLTEDYEKEKKRILATDPNRESMEWEMLTKDAKSIRTAKYGDACITVFHWPTIKWYNDYPEIQYFMNFLEETCSESRIYRLGEDSDDIEERYFNKCSKEYILDGLGYIDKNVVLDGVTYLDAFGSEITEDYIQSDIAVLQDSIDRLDARLSSEVVTPDEIKKLLKEWTRSLKKIKEQIT